MNEKSPFWRPHRILFVGGLILGAMFCLLLPDYEVGQYVAASRYASDAHFERVTFDSTLPFVHVYYRIDYFGSGGERIVWSPAWNRRISTWQVIVSDAIPSCVR